MSSVTVSASSLAFVKRTSYSNWGSKGAYQGAYSSGYPRVGAMRFKGLLDVNWPNQRISKIEMTMKFAAAGGAWKKTIYMYRGAKSSISGTGSSMMGKYIGSFNAGVAYNNSQTVTFSESSNSSVFSGLVAWLQSMTTTSLTIYHNESGSSEYTNNYLLIKSASLKITYEPAGSNGTLDKTDVTAGETVNLTITPIETEGTITHSVMWKMGEAYSDAVDPGSALTTSFTVPMDWLSQIPNAASGAAECLITTFVDGTERATRSFPFTVHAPASVVPTFDAAIAPSGTSGGYYQHIGGAVISISNAASAYGATITGYRITGTDSVDSTAAAVTTADFVTAGTHTYTLSVTDSRGRTTAKPLSIDVIALAKPVISTFKAGRYAAKIDDAGDTVYEDNLSGGHVWFAINARYDTAGGNNTPTAYILYNLLGSSEKTRIDIPWPEGSEALTTVDDRTILTADVPVNAAYEFTLYLCDEHYTVSRASRVDKSFAAMHFAGNGHGVSVGMFSNGTAMEPMFEVAPEYTARLHGGVWGANEYRLDRVAKYANFDITNTSFAEYHADIPPRVSRVGVQCFLDGMITNTKAISSGNDHLIGVLPEWAWPQQDVHAIHQGTSRCVFWLRIKANGEVWILRYRNEEGYADANSGSQYMLTSRWVASDAYLAAFMVAVTLTNITSDNSLTEVIESSPYIAKLTPDVGMAITSVRVTMAGTDITASVYAAGNIRINKVEGDITVVATAEYTTVTLIIVKHDGNGYVTFEETVSGSLLAEYDSESGLITVTQYASATASYSNGRVTLE